MKDKEKQIEEMARTFCPYGDNAIIHQSCELCKQVLNGDCDCFRNAKKLYNKLFPEDSVVLSREKIDIYEVSLKENLTMRKELDKVIDKIEEVEKETAEKFYNLVKEKIEQIEKFYFDNGKIGYNGLTVRELKELAKQFGVEIKE